jgi:tRNA(Ile)-lysidine synthase
MVGALLIDAVRGLEGTIWRISAAPRRKAAKKG